MGGESNTSNLLSKTKKIGYYAGLVFGVGYSLTFVGYLVTFISMWFRLYDPLYIAFMVFTLAGIILGIYLGITVGKNSRSLTDSGLKVETISSSVYAYSLMLILMGIGGTVLAAWSGLFRPPDHWAGPGLPRHPFIASIIGPILLLIGFRVYRGQTSKLKLMGAIMMVASVILTYFIGWNFLGFVGSGALLSAGLLEGIALLLAALGASASILVNRSEETKQQACRIILLISGIIFSCGVIYNIFSIISSIHFVMGFISIYIAGYFYPVMFVLPNLAELISFSEGFPWIIFTGFTVIGVSGILALIAVCMSFGISAKQISIIRRRDETTQTEQQT